MTVTPEQARGKREVDPELDACIARVDAHLCSEEPDERGEWHVCVDEFPRRVLDALAHTYRAAGWGASVTNYGMGHGALVLWSR